MTTPKARRVRFTVFASIIGACIAAGFASTLYVIDTFTQRSNAATERREVAQNAQINTCRRIHTLVNVLTQEEINGRAELDRLEREGLITESQHDRFVRASRKAITRLRTADCDLAVLKLGFGRLR